MINFFREKSFRETPYLSPLGIFVWGDAIVILPFWILTMILSLIFQNVYFFLLVFSVFWTVRSLGEIMYWLNQQFSGRNRNPPEKLKFYFLVKSEAVWFLYQVYWECVLVFAAISSIFFAFLWIRSI